MMLESLNIPNLKIDILEANSRVGGRIFTHRFSNDDDDYYDVGAMRFPKIAIMKRAFDLFKMTKMEIIPYYLDGGPSCPSLFNDRLFVPDTKDPFHISNSNGGVVPDNLAHPDDVGAAMNAVFEPYKTALEEDFDRGFRLLLSVDDFSTREYLRRGGPNGDRESRYDFHTIQWMETLSTGTNLFDQAFAESVVDSFHFDGSSNADPATWWRIKGGTERLTHEMQRRLRTKVQTGKRVEGIYMNPDSAAREASMSVMCAGERKKREGYHTVFNTTSLGCLGRMDMTTLDLHPVQRDAIRSLHYDDSTKVALKFSHPWWIDHGITHGGAGSTDRPIRVCVYPSYESNDKDEILKKPAVLLASYTWSQDATRMGSLLQPGAVHPKEAELVDLILRDLASLHNLAYDDLKKLYIGVHHGFSWSQDPFTAGAFALFGPGQFSNFYPYLTRPASKGNFHIVGEAASTHHAWVVGSLNSAYAAVYKFLLQHHLFQYMDRHTQLWGTVDEFDSSETGIAHLQVALAHLEEGEKLKI
ncbi:uncharacterized protein TRIVIDRAFT_47086 [Trichoderma virens Gv29-8]|uniref:Amine oxidase domain-containing protein n=1 Tax=Hypocrea virens (strain Gv29-8 / FGSC 10586) TaxID=413071 RepID=G9N0R9_HYPVG|nr:uncharacterized protein TRIVIDRAFT_47086 [Trichoderma virens Gv29-8]EHK19951.1 hypothetical protein TRIVIDRAFT_47086 [Trichoderma virens Gv29-8]